MKKKQQNKTKKGKNKNNELKTFFEQLWNINFQEKKYL